MTKVSTKENKMKKINENQKITLTVGQLKRLVRESTEFDPRGAVREARFARFPKDNDALLKTRINKFSMEKFGRRLLDGMKNVESFREDLEELEEIVLKNPDYLEKVNGIDIDVDWNTYLGLDDTPGEFRFFSDVYDKTAHLGVMSYGSDRNCETVLWYQPSKNLWFINVVGEDSSDVFKGTSAETVVKELYAKVGNKPDEMDSLTDVIDALNNRIDSFLDNIEKQFSELTEITEGRFRKFLDKDVVMERHVSSRAARRERKLNDKNRPGKY